MQKKKNKGKQQGNKRRIRLIKRKRVENEYNKSEKLRKKENWEKERSG